MKWKPIARRQGEVACRFGTYDVNADILVQLFYALGPGGRPFFWCNFDDPEDVLYFVTMVLKFGPTARVELISRSHFSSAPSSRRQLVLQSL